MVKKFLLALMAVMILLSGCGNKSQESQYSIDYDMDTVLNNQKIIFIMSISSYEEPYAAGYFIDQTGRKHIYRYDPGPFESIEQEYTYLLEHYAEFEVKDFFGDSKLRKCIDYLYHVNPDSEIRSEGEVIFDAPEKILYGVRMVDNHEEFVWLGEEPGISKRLDDPSADLIFQEFGNKWYLLDSQDEPSLIPKGTIDTERKVEPSIAPLD